MIGKDAVKAEERLNFEKETKIQDLLFSTLAFVLFLLLAYGVQQ